VDERVSRSKGPRHRWTDEDAAFATAQVASGIHIRDVAASFGYRTTGPVWDQIERFQRKYTKPKPWHAEFSRIYKAGQPFRTDIFDPVKDCIAAFVKHRNEMSA
jgi:transposase